MKASCLGVVTLAALVVIQTSAGGDKEKRIVKRHTARSLPSTTRLGILDLEQSYSLCKDKTGFIEDTDGPCKNTYYFCLPDGRAAKLKCIVQNRVRCVFFLTL